jgi:hypothetical protein
MIDAGECLRRLRRTDRDVSHFLIVCGSDQAFLLPPLSTLSGMDLIGQVQRRLSGSPGGLDADWIDDGRWDGGAVTIDC